jgi:hypothetical protein
VRLGQNSLSYSPHSVPNLTHSLSGGQASMRIIDGLDTPFNWPEFDCPSAPTILLRQCEDW